LLYAVRDRVVERQPVRERGRVKRYQVVIKDHGVADKRVLLIEEEFAQALRAMTREGNILSPILRQAWDTGDLRPLTKNNPLTVTGAHISVVAHITQGELVLALTRTDQANGLGNRFLWVAVRRFNFIPTPTGLSKPTRRRLVAKLRAAATFARSIKQLKRSRRAESHWVKIYRRLSTGIPGLLGAMLARSEAQVMRLACIYALLDQSPVVRLTHLKAALALWNYCETSTCWIFGQSLGNYAADRILTALRNKGSLSETKIQQLFAGHKSRHEIQDALSSLERCRLAVSERKSTRGRPRTVWTYHPRPTKRRHHGTH
jgi:hypothetical protein